MLLSLKHLFNLLNRSQKNRLILLQVLVIINSIFEVVSVVTVGGFMSLVGSFNLIETTVLYIELSKIFTISSPSDFLLFGAFITLFVLLVTAIISLFTLWRLSLFGALVGADLSNRLYYFYMQKDWIFHSSNNSSDLKNRIANESLRISNGVINHLMLMNSKIIMSVVMSIALMIYNVYVAMTAAIIFSISYFFLYKTARARLIRNGSITSFAQALRLKLMGEGFGGIKDVLLLRRQALFNKSFFKASNNFARAAGSSQVLSMGPRYIMELVAFSSVILLVIFLLITYEGNIGTILPMLTIYALAGFKLLPAFQQIYYSLTTIRVNIHAFHVLQDDLESSDSDYLTNQFVESNEFQDKKLDLQQSIQLRNIKFKYPHAQQNALNEINLEIPANHVIGIVGSSGSGKSTLIDILLGLIRPDEGQLLIDGEVISSKNIKIWQNSLGFVPQSIFLADSTIKENIGFGLAEDDIDLKKVSQAIDMSHLREFVDALEHGIETIVGERGVQLSGGQRQRIGIARALYQNASVLVLDEATSSLDGISEMLIMNAINDFFGKKTIVIIAHRLSTIKNCNSIYILEDGRILDHGTYDELKQHNKFFQTLLSPDQQEQKVN